MATEVLNFAAAGAPNSYYERRFDGKRTFEIADGRLQINGSNDLRSDFAVSFDLSGISPVYSVLRIRHQLFFIALLMAAAGVLVGLLKDALPVVIALVVAGLVLMAATVRKQTFYQFRFLTGGVAFDICEAGPQKATVEAFAHAVVAAIQAHAPPSQ